MRRTSIRLVIMCIALFCLVSVASAARCPYCGKEYGGGSGSDSAYIQRIRAEHEANCPMRPRGTRPGTRSDDAAVRARRWEYAEARYNWALEAYNKGNYDRAIRLLGIALWNSWGNRKYTALLRKAQKRKAAQVAHQTGLTYEKSGHWDLAVRLFGDALKGHPENTTYAASLKRARREQDRVVQRALDDKLATLSSELGRASPGLTLSFRAPGDLTSRPSIDRIVVPTPRIRAKDYFQIETPERWPELPKQAVTLTNAALVKLQKGAEWGAQKTVDKLEGMALSKFTDRIPGYHLYSSLKGQFKELNEGYGAHVIAMAEGDVAAVRRAVLAVGGARDAGELVESHYRDFEKTGRRTQWGAAKLAGKTVKSKLEGNTRLDKTKDASGRHPTLTIQKRPVHVDERRWFSRN